MSVFRARGILLACLLSVCSPTLGDVDRDPDRTSQTVSQIGEAPDGSPLHFWNPGESWPGGLQFDPRLDQPVNFWKAGISLSEVFASVNDQIAVEIGFVPPGDDNERICVTLYLNSDDPPSLRELMAQLSWVTGCMFASDGRQQPHYYLLHTSKEGGPLERVQRERAEQQEALARASDEMHAGIRDTMLAKLPELRNALALSREEAIRRYHGTDDCLLLAALDPLRRATAEVVLALVEDRVGQLRTDLGVQTRFRLSQLTPARRAVVLGAVEVHLPTWQQLVQPHLEEPDAQGRWTDWSWVEEMDPEVLVVTGATGFFVVIRDPDGRGEHGNASAAFRLRRLQVLADPRTYGPEESAIEVDLRRLLGEEIGEEEERRIHLAFRERRAQIDQRSRLEAVLRGSFTLSADTEALLSDLRLPIGPDHSYTLWQIQELVAATSGRHVVSDCFVQNPYSMRGDFDVLRLDAEPKVSALLALASMCRMKRPPHDMSSIGLDGWEWGDAGAFLRFRSRERALCRAAFLPQSICNALDAWLAPHLPEQGNSEQSWPAIFVPADLQRCAWLVARLSPEQIAWGGTLVYEDLSDPVNAYRHYFRGQVMGMLQQAGHLCEMFQAFGEDEWDRLLDEGIVWGGSFSAAATQHDRERGFWTERRRGDVLRLVEPNELALADVQADVGPIDFLIVTVARDGEAIESEALPLNIYVAPKPVASLIAREVHSECVP